MPPRCGPSRIHVRRRPCGRLPCFVGPPRACWRLRASRSSAKSGGESSVFVTSAIFLADCGPKPGLGHLRRLLVLAAGFQREAFDCRFLLTDMRYADFVERCGMPAAPWAGAKPDLPRADVVAIDGYHFDVGLPSQWSAQT